MKRNLFVAQLDMIRPLIEAVLKRLPTELQRGVVYDYVSEYVELRELLQATAVHTEQDELREVLLELQAAVRDVQDHLRRWNAGAVKRTRWNETSSNTHYKLARERLEGSAITLLKVDVVEDKEESPAPNSWDQHRDGNILTCWADILKALGVSTSGANRKLVKAHGKRFGGPISWPSPRKPRVDRGALLYWWRNVERGADQADQGRESRRSLSNYHEQQRLGFHQEERPNARQRAGEAPPD